MTVWHLECIDEEIPQAGQKLERLVACSRVVAVVDKEIATVAGISVRRWIPLLLATLISISACAKGGDQAVSDAVSNAELASIRNDLEVYASLAEHGNADIGLKQKMAQSILRHVLLIRAAAPEIDSFRGEALETICLLTEPETRKILDDAGDPQLAGLAHKYLLSIEPEIRNKIANYQQTMKGTGCYLTPNVSR